MMNYSMEGRTYRYLLSDPLYPFGYGLSYSQFSYDYLAAFSNRDPKQDLSVQLLLSNKGNVDSDEVKLIFVCSLCLHINFNCFKGASISRT